MEVGRLFSEHGLQRPRRLQAAETVWARVGIVWGGVKVGRKSEVHVSAEVYRRLTIRSPARCCCVAQQCCGVDGGVDQEKQHSFRHPRFLDVSSV